jgi:ABC-type phosphate/phosphonate transport system ATPase subunit
MMIGQQYYVASEATMKVENLSKLYVSSMAKVVSPRNVNSTVNKGEFVSLVGPSGRRKSTKIGISNNHKCILPETIRPIYLTNS